jgi:hypothetical protein
VGNFKEKNMPEDKVKDILFKKSPEEYGDEFKSHSLEIYKLYVSMADNISARRQAANSFFLTINTGLLAFLGYAKPLFGEPAGRLVLLVTLAGIVLCFSWYRLIKSYKGLNSGKFKVIHLMEGNLPLAPYDAEWEVVGRGKDRKKYVPFTHVEIYIPWVFFTIYVVLLFTFLPLREICQHVIKVP